MVPSQSFELKSQTVCAGAGTGKTHSLIEEILKIYKIFKKEKEQEPNLIVCTFTIKATQELRERLYKKAIEIKDWNFLSYLQSPSLHISTIDSILSLFLRNYAYKYDLTPDFILEDTQKEKQLFNELSEKYFFEKHSHLLEGMMFYDLQKALKFYIETKLKYGNVGLFDELDFKQFNKEREFYQKDPLNYKEEIKEIKKEPESFDERHFVAFFREFKTMAEEFFEEYLIQKKRQGCLVMNDLPLLSLDLLRKHPHIAQSFSKEWNYWFIDEYQDTSWVQEQIIKQITDFKNVFCVGDPKQSIYFFREADPTVFKRRLDASIGRVRELNVNRRSNSSLIHFFNDFFTKEEGFLSFQPPNEKLTSKESEEPCISFLMYDQEQEEAFESIYYFIQQLLDKGNSLGDIAILSRKNSDLSSLASFLKEKKVHFFLHGSNRFSNNRLILDSLFLFKFLMNPYDNTNLIALFRTPYFYLKDQKIADLCHEYHQFCKKEKKSSLWSYLENKHLEKEKVIQQLKKYLDIEKTSGLLKVFEQALLENAFLDFSYYQDASGASESNLWKLLYLLHHSSNPLELFYSFMEDDLFEKKEKEAVSFLNFNAVQLMTIHNSKGLEFKHVILCDLSIGLSNKSNRNNDCVFDLKKRKMAFSLPVGNRRKKKVRSHGHKKVVYKIQKRELEERDRLFYVAMTRAEESLTLLLPSKKIQKTSWLYQISFFKPFLDITYKDFKPDKGIQNWSLREGLYQRGSYSFMVKHHFKYSSKKKSLESSVGLISPFPDKEVKKNYMKSSKDFCIDIQKEPNVKNTLQDIKNQNKISKDFQSNGKNQKDHSQKVIIPQVKNKIFTMNLGNHLHHYLRLLSKHSLDTVVFKLKNSYFSKEEKEEIQKGLQYVSHLKDPDFNFFFKNGESEWSFKFKKENVILQGQIDLWGKKSDKELWVFDYKSVFSENVEKQLVFYSWILDNMYQIETIKMCEVYPFQKQIKIKKYEEKHKKQMEGWLKQLI